MKTCNLCQEKKPCSDFYTNGKYPSGKQKYKPKCKKCEYSFDLERLREVIRAFYGELKCQRCGYANYAGALECHHRRPSEKDFEICKMKTFSEDRIKRELAKCDLLCANCHREVHFEMGG